MNQATKRVNAVRMYGSNPFSLASAIRIIYLTCKSHDPRGALDLAKGKVNGVGGAAERRRIHPNTLRKRMDKLGIRYKRRK
ncbi:MAG TPA: hypothetical protein EYP19_01655 [Desulfobacterales bacterium]|nr:hypothetical protein [Desulfobacterales bacterium]